MMTVRGTVLSAEHREKIRQSMVRAWVKRHAKLEVERERRRHAAEASAPSLLTIPEAAERAGHVSERTLTDACLRQRLPATRVGNQWLVRPQDLDAWARARGRHGGVARLLADVLGTGRHLPRVTDPEGLERRVLGLLGESPSPNMALIVSRLYGLDGAGRVSQTELARERGVTRQAISGVRREALERLRRPENRAQLEELLG